MKKNIVKICIYRNLGIICLISLILSLAVNGEWQFFRWGVRERWFGWPFIYYGNIGPGSLDYGIYIVPMALNILVFILMSSIIVLIASLICKNLNLKLKYNNKLLIYFIFLITLLYVLTIVSLCNTFRVCCGPRGELHYSDKIIIGPRLVLNPIA